MKLVEARPDDRRGSGMILIIGGSGRLGQEVARQLLKTGKAVRVSSRNPKGLSNLVELGAEAIKLDLRKPADFAPALKGVSRVLTAAHALTARRSDSIGAVDLMGHQQLIDAAQQAGVERFIYTSAQGARLNHPAHFWSAKAAVEAHLLKVGMSYTILRPSAFMDFYAFELIGKPILNGKPVNLLGNGAQSRNLVAVNDVVQVAVKALISDLYADTCIEIRGPEDLSDKEVIGLYETHLGLTAKVRAVPQWALWPLAKIFAPFHAGISNILRLPGLLVDTGEQRPQSINTIVGTTSVLADPQLSNRRMEMGLI